jgi:hypothetical protein
MNSLSWEDMEEMHNRHTEHNEHKPHHQLTIEEEILMKINELLTVNQSIKGQLNKAEAEIVGKLTHLQAAIDNLTQAAQNLDLPDEVVASIGEVQAASQALDDIVPDEVPAPVDPTEPTEPTARRR